MRLSEQRQYAEAQREDARLKLRRKMKWIQSQLDKVIGEAEKEGAVGVCGSLDAILVILSEELEREERVHRETAAILKIKNRA